MTVIEQQTLDETVAFVDLVLGDDEWALAEFDALIAECWGSPCEPPCDKLSPPAGGWTAGPPSRWPRRPGRPLPAAMPTRRPEGRGRSPPGQLT